LELLTTLKRSVVIAALLSAGCPAAPVRAQSVTEAPDYKIKAAYIFNFARFVEWPQAAFPAPDSPMVIGVMGNDTVASYMRKALANQTVAGRPLVIKTVRPEQEVKNTHILYVAESERDVERAVICGSGSPTLTVSQVPNFISQGGMIQLGVEKNQVVFHLNKTAIEHAGMNVSSQMLQYAAPEGQ
jgi:hypothetical protein